MRGAEILDLTLGVKGEFHLGTFFPSGAQPHTTSTHPTGLQRLFQARATRARKSHSPGWGGKAPCIWKRGL